MTFVVGLGVFEDKTVGPLQAIGALLHTVGSIFEVEAFYTLVWALREETNKEEGEMSGRVKRRWWTVDEWRSERRGIR